MPFAAEDRQGRWFVCNGPISFGPYRTREKAEDSAASLNRRTQGGSKPPLTPANHHGLEEVA